LLAALTICSRNFSRTGEPSFLIPLGVAAIAYLLAIRELFLGPQPRRVIFFGLALALAWQLEFVRTPPSSDDDIHRYLWDGRVQRLGYNPYVLIPNDPAVAGLHTTETRTLNNPEVASPYPPGAQLFFRAVIAIRESTFALKWAFLLCNALVVVVLLDVLRRTRQGQHWVLAYAWHPLVAIEVVGSGHIDIVGVLLLVASGAALLRRWRALAAVALALSIGVKLLPIVLLPLYWKRVRIRDALLAALVFGLLYVPFVDHGRIPLGSLGTYIQRFRFNDPVFMALERVTAPQIAAAVAVVFGLLTAMWMRRKSLELLPDALAWPMAASLLCAPVVYPWYLLWVVPFARSLSTVPILVWTLSVIGTYYVWYLRTLGQPWLVPRWIMVLEYGSLAVAAAICLMVRFKRSTALECSADQAE
jgi:alpha-1,6-mannosyltransferase